MPDGMAGRVPAAPLQTVVPVPTSAPAATAGAVEGRSAARWWVPAPGLQPWQWELEHPLDVSSGTDMGTGATLPDGRAAPAPVIYDIDGFDNSAATVAELHRRGLRVVCYLEVGAAESYRPDYRQFPAAALGEAVPDYPQERYLDIRRPDVLAVMETRIAMCAQKGFDAIETDIDQSYRDRSGFALDQADEVRYMTTLADRMHSLGLGWWIKNPDATGDSYARLMQPLADAVLSEQCNEYSTCDLLRAYQGKKAVFDAEYGPETTTGFCAADVAEGFSGELFDVALSGTRHPCA